MSKIDDLTIRRIKDAADIVDVVGDFVALNKLLPAWWIVNVPLSYLTGGLTLLFTVWSGINYFIGMWKYLDPEK